MKPYFTNQKAVKLLKSLPNCPKGRTFITNTAGDYFHSMTDKEYIGRKLKMYEFTKEEVENNPKWFSKPKLINGK